MKLTAYVIDGYSLDIRPAPVEREWMDGTDQRFAYRCLPLNIANAHGWEVLCPSGFSAVWSGARDLDAVAVSPEPNTKAPAISHFGQGILTFHLPCVFRTEAGYDLMVVGPINRPKDGIAPLSAVIETDWAPYSFTMNWVFTRPGRRTWFEKGEPFCQLFPFRRGEIEQVQPELRSLSQAPEMRQQYDTWRTRRRQFITDLKEPGSTAQSERWQKHYYQGLDPEGQKAGIEDHRTRLRVRPFVKR